MKSLRIHFFNRHGIDLDNPGPNAPSSLLLALDASNASSYLPSIALAAAAAAAAANSANNLSLAANNNSVTAYSDSGDSLQVCCQYIFFPQHSPLIFNEHTFFVIYFNAYVIYVGFIEIEWKWDTAYAFSYSTCWNIHGR